MPLPTWEDGVKSKPTYLANFDWSKAFWNPLNGLETMNVVAMKGPGGTQEVAQLWVIGKLEYTTLVVNQYPTFNNSHDALEMGQLSKRLGSFQH